MLFRDKSVIIISMDNKKCIEIGNVAYRHEKLCDSYNSISNFRLILLKM